MTISMRASVRTAAVLSGLALMLAACGDDEPTTSTTAPSGAAELSGTVKIDGSSTVEPLTAIASELFAKEASKVQVPVGTSGTGGGFEKFCNKETDISNASRAIKDEEKAACQKNGVTYTELQVAIDALTVVVHKDNTWASCLSVEQLKMIWEPNSKVSNWNQVDPKFPNEPLKLAGAGSDSGTFDYFTKEINGEEGASRKDYSASENDNDTVNVVANSKGGLGYFGFSYFEENESKLKAVQIKGENGQCVAPSVQTAQDGTYSPLARPLFIYPNNEAVKRPEVMGFIEFYAKNVDEITTAAKFIPLNAGDKTKLTTAVTGLKG